MSTNEAIKLPIRNRIAYKQTLFVVALAFILGLLFSLTQIYVDYRKQTGKLASTIHQVVSTMKQPAAEAAFHLDAKLAKQVGNGLFEYAPIVDVQILGYMGEDQPSASLVSMKRPQQSLKYQSLSTFLFGDQQTNEVALYVEQDRVTRAGTLIVSADPHEIASGFIDRSINVVLFGVLRTGVFALFVLFFFYYSVTRPLEQMSRSWSNIDPEDSSQSRLSLPENHEKDEFGLLAKNANRFLVAVEQHLARRLIAEQELQETNEALEQRVASRTAELEAEILERCKAEKSLQDKTEVIELLKAIAVTANEATSFKDAFQHALEVICQRIGFPVARAIVIAKDQAEMSLPTTLWHMEEERRWNDFAERMDSLGLESYRGILERVLSSGRPIWIRNITQEAKFSWMEDDQTFCTDFAFPVQVGQSVVAVLEFFSPRELDPFEAFIDVTRDVGIQLGRVVEREWVAEKLTAAKEEAEAATQAKSTFLATMSHEIRTPMNGVMGMLQVLERSPLNDKQKDAIVVLRDSAFMLTTVIDDILDFSKIEAGQVEVELVPFSPQTTFESVTALMSSRAGEKGLSFNLEIDENVPDTLIGDPVRLQQILLNLVNNAIKFTESGYVTVRVKNTGDVGNRVGLYFEVCDSGCGLTEQQQARLFQPFVQADASTTRRFGGTGLGLSICLRLVELLGGEIGVESQPDKGSRFWFSLSFMKTDEVVFRDSDVFDSRPPALTLMLVEDNAINREVARALLSAEGHTVVCASDGKQALTMLPEASIDAIFMDMHMPEMDGLEATRRIRSLGTDQARVPVIMLTANVLPTFRATSYEAGVDHFIAKPFELEQVNQVLVDLFGARDEAGDESLLPSLLEPEPGERAEIASIKTHEEKVEGELVNIAGFGAMRESIGDEILKELLGDFFRQCQKSIKILETALSEKNLVITSDTAHSLRGAAQELKAIRLAQIASAIERSKDLAEITELFQQLKVSVMKTQEAYFQIDLFFDSNHTDS